MYEEEELRFDKLDLKIWRKIFKIIIRNPKALLMMIISIIFLTIIDIGYPILNSLTLETFFSKNPVFTNQTIVIYISCYFIIAILMGLSVWLFIRGAVIVEETTTYQIRLLAFEKIQELSFSYYDTTPSGWIMARMTSDCRKLSSIVSWGIVDILWGICIMIGILIASFVIFWRLALILLLLIPIFLLFTIYYRRKILKEYREVRKINSQITASYNEGFMGAITSKTLAIEGDNRKEFFGLTAKMLRRSVKAACFKVMFWPTVLVIGYFGIAVIYGFGADLVIKDLITIAQLYLFIDYGIKFFDPVMLLSRTLADFQQAQASAERVISLIETEVEIKDQPEVIAKYGDIFNHLTENWEEIDGEIEFKNVSFKYKNTDQYVLKDFNLKIKAGEIVALVGETGSGKSTIVNLISRFYEPTSGEILIDGINYQNRSIAWLHARLGYVLQTPQLFSTTIGENIRYGKLDATDEEVIAAARLANADKFIDKLEQGYATEIGEGGNKLSLGEKQLLSFARAVIKQPSIIVLDEATSSIDTENEKVILEAMKTVLKGRTSLMVAHRLSTVVGADRILVLKHGKIIEEGNHQSLLAQKGYYFELYRNQFLQTIEEKILKTAL